MLKIYILGASFSLLSFLNAQTTYYGFMNKSAEWAIDPKIEQAGDFSEGFAKVFQDNKYSFLNKNGKALKDAQFESAGDFSEGFAPVQTEDGWTMLNAQGIFVFETKYQSLQSFSEGLAGFKLKDKWGFLNKAEKIVVQAQFEEVRPFKNGYAVVKMDGKYGLLAQSGGLVIPCWYEVVHPTEGKLVLVESTRKKMLFSLKGKPLNLPEGCTPEHISENLILIKNQKGLFGYANFQGNLQIPCLYEQAQGFSEGLANVLLNGKGQTIDKTGKLVFLHPVETEGALPQPFKEGIAGFSNRKKLYGLLDKTGKMILKPTYEAIDAFSEGLARVEMDKKSGFINLKGELQIPIQYQTKQAFKEGVVVLGIAQ
jgi:hypothetical protein